MASLAVEPDARYFTVRVCRKHGSFLAECADDPCPETNHCHATTPVSLTRQQRFSALLKEVVDYNREGAAEDEPARYLVGEYDSGDLIWLYTRATLEECDVQINAGDCRDVTVYDLDTGREHRVQFSATVTR